MSKLMMFTLGAVILALLFYMQADYQEAMAQCQVEHSFDTCFHSLNR